MTTPAHPVRSAASRTGRGMRGVVCLMVAGLSSWPATAADPPPPVIDLAPAEVVAEPAGTPVRIGGPPPRPCVTVDIAGHHAGHLDCAAEALREAARIARAMARAAIGTPVPRAGAPDVTVGVSSLSGARLRMGDALGHSVIPQRPDRSYTPPPPGGRP